jgi:hypothetical protein
LLSKEKKKNSPLLPPLPSAKLESFLELSTILKDSNTLVIYYIASRL